MRRSLAAITILAFGLLAGAWSLATGGAPDLMGALRPRGASVTIDFASFAMGVAAGIGGVWLSRVPWGDIPRAVLGMLLGLRRNVVLAGFALACTGVLLFY